MSKSNKFCENEIFEMNGLFYIIPQDKYEPREIFISRVWFILNEIKKSNGVFEFNNLVIQSRIYANTKFLGCKYKLSN